MILKKFRYAESEEHRSLCYNAASVKFVSTEKQEIAEQPQDGNAAVQKNSIDSIFSGPVFAVRNAPTLRTRRCKLYHLFGQLQYGILAFSCFYVVFFTGLVYLKVGQIIGYNFSIPWLTYVFYVFIFILIIPQAIRVTRHGRAIAADELGLSEKPVTSYSYAQTERKLHLSIITNALLLETICGAVLFLPMLDGKTMPYYGMVFTVCIGSTFGLLLYNYFLHGKRSLTLCQSVSNLTDYPPLIKKHFEVFMGLEPFPFNIPFFNTPLPQYSRWFNRHRFFSGVMMTIALLFCLPALWHAYGDAIVPFAINMTFFTLTGLAAMWSMGYFSRYTGDKQALLDAIAQFKPENLPAEELPDPQPFPKKWFAAFVLYAMFILALYAILL